MTTDESSADQQRDGAEEDAPGVRQDHDTGATTVDPKTAGEMAEPAADRAESESREGRTEP